MRRALEGNEAHADGGVGFLDLRRSHGVIADLCAPLNQGVEVADVVAALRYLIDSTTMTGQTLILDGGQRFLSLPRDVQFLEK